MEKLTETATQTVELVARVGRLVQELKALAEDAGLSGDEITGPAEDMPEAVSRRISGRLSAVETQCDDLSTQCGTIETDLAALGEEVGSRYHGLNTLINSAGHSILKVGNNIALRNKDSNIISTASDIASASDVTALTERVASAEGRIRYVEADLDALIARVGAIGKTLGAMDALSDPKTVLEAYGPEAVQALHPDVIAICEPANAAFVLLYGATPQKWKERTQVRINAVDGVIRLPADIHDAFMAAEEKLAYIMSAEKVLYMHLIDGSSFRFPSPTFDGVLKSGLIKAADKTARLSYLGPIMGMEQMPSCGWLNEDSSYYVARFADHMRIVGEWNTVRSTDFENMLMSCCNDTVFDELPKTINVSSVTNANPRALLHVFECVNALDFPSIDLKGVGPWPGLFAWQANPDGVYVKHDASWMPERPQHHITYNLGHTLPTGTAKYYCWYQGIRDWDYDDMIATLITHSHSVKGRLPGEINLSPVSYDKLTSSDRAKIINKGYSIVRKID